MVQWIRGHLPTLKDLGLILGQGTEIPRATGQLLSNKEPMCSNEDPLQWGEKKEKINENKAGSVKRYT